MLRGEPMNSLETPRRPGRSRSILAIQVALNLNLIFLWPLVNPFLGITARLGAVAVFVLTNIVLIAGGEKMAGRAVWFVRSPARVRGLLLLTSVVLTLGGVEYLAKGLTKIGVLTFDQPMRTMVPEGTEDWRLAHITADRFREADPVLFWRPIAAPPYTRQRFKGPEVEQPKPPGVIRIICYGDSNTDGPSRGSWPEQFQAVLEAHGSLAWKYEVLNAGVAGYSSYQGLLRFRSQVEAFEPDLVFVSFGWNDLAPALGAPDRMFVPPPRWRIGLRRLLLQYRSYLVARRHLWSPRGPAGNTSRDPRVDLDDYIENMRGFARLAREHGAEIVFLTRPHRVPPEVLADADGGWRPGGGVADCRRAGLVQVARPGVVRRPEPLLR